MPYEPEEVIPEEIEPEEAIPQPPPTTSTSTASRYEVTTYGGKKAWTRTVLGKEIMWVLESNGLQQYRNDVPMGAMGTAGFLPKGTSGYLGILAHLLADGGGYILSQSRFKERASMYLAGNTANIGEEALRYIEMADRM